jgi:formylglycine-generating enzyme required for sulfatase activity
MLLAYIEELMNRDPKIEKGNEYSIYDALVYNWLRREKEKNPKIDIEKLYNACIILAVWMQSEQKGGKIEEAELDNLKKSKIAILGTAKQIKQLDMKGRSLINRNTDGSYRFSHFSILEFLVAKYISEKPLFRPNNKILLTYKTVKFVKDSGEIHPEISPRLFDFTQIDQIKLNQKKITKHGMEFVYIPPDVFKMGSPDNELNREKVELLHNVMLTQGFYLQTTPVTQNQWEALMGNNPSEFKGDGERPVETVLWKDAQSFIEKLNMKEGRKVFGLPTEAQWEYACRAGTETSYYTGDTEADLDRAGWFYENANRTTHSVAQKEPNSFGLCDMHGNVREWCQDWYGDYPSGSVTDPEGPLSGSSRVIRGGSWHDSARGCRSAFRGRDVPDPRLNVLGFRLVLLPGQHG